jgi:hypothetical protein
LGLVDQLYDEQKNELPSEVRINFVHPGGLGDRLGIREGDVLVRYGLIPIRTPSQLPAITQAEHEAGVVFLSPTIVLRRGAETVQIKKTEAGLLRIMAALYARPVSAETRATAEPGTLQAIQPLGN